jgi:hypothetical protein
MQGPGRCGSVPLPREIDMASPTGAASCASNAGKSATPDRRSLYSKLLTWAFALFGSTRLLTYLPTLWAIHASGDSSQHSLLTWLAWLGSHATMAAWLYEDNGRRVNKVVVVTCGNAVMCVLTSVLILVYR